MEIIKFMVPKHQPVINPPQIFPWISAYFSHFHRVSPGDFPHLEAPLVQRRRLRQAPPHRRRAVRGHDCGRGAEDAAGHGGHQAAAGAQVQDAEGTVTWGKSQGKPPKIGEKYGKPGGFSWDFELFHVFFTDF